MSKEALRLAIEYLPISVLRPWPSNARTHSKKQIHQIANSIREFGFTNPVLIDSENVIVAGHGRVEAARVIGMSSVPTICLDHLTSQQKRALIIADNRLALNAGWDPEILKIEFQHLAVEDLEFDLEITGFESAEIDLLLDSSAKPNAADPADVVPALEQTPVSRLGDVWRLGEHKIICGDSRDAEPYKRLLGPEKTRLTFADAPYNVCIQGHAGGLGSIKHREFSMAAGEMTSPEFSAFLNRVFANAIDRSIDGAIHYICMDWRHISELLNATKSLYSELKNLCVWNKTNGGMGSFYRSKHELIFVFKVGTASHINNIDLGRSGRYRTNVWDYGGVNSFGRSRLEELAMHPTVKPVVLVADAIKDCSRRKDIVFDPFAGSGTTLIAAEKTGRRARLIEIDPLYVDLIVRRWQTFTGGIAVHSSSAQSFAEITQRRMEEINDV
jgi:DNA modification methylase